MAIRLADAVVFLRGDRSQLEQDLQASERSTRGWASRLGGSVRGLISNALVAGVATAAAAIGAAGAVAFDVARDMDDATNQIATTMGVSREEAEAYGGAIRRVYSQGLGDSIQDVGGAVGEVARQLRLAADDPALARITQRAYGLRDAFGADFQETLRAARVLVNSGLAPDFDQAMNIIAAGFQNGLNGADDLLDTLAEYSDDFQDLGFTADETLGVLNRGLEAGIFNTDKIGDLINEFGVNLRDPAIGQSLADIDEGIAGIYDAFQQGEITEREAFESILANLAALEDPIARDQAGVLLFRSMWEDLGESAVLALGDMEAGLISVEGAADTLGTQYENLGQFLESLKRRARLALEPVGDVLLDLGQRVMPYVERGFSWFEARIVPAIERAADALGDFFDLFFSNIDEGQDPLTALRNALAEMVPPETMAVIDQVVATLRQLFDWGSAIAEAALPLLAQAWGWLQERLDVILPILGIVAAVIAAIQSPILLVVGAIGLLAAAWANNWGGIRDKASEVWEKIEPILSGIGSWIVDTAIPKLRELGQVFDAKVGSKIREFWKNSLSWLWERAKVVWGWIKETAIPQLREWGQAFMRGLKPFTDRIMPRLRQFSNQISPKLNEAIASITDLWDKLKETWQRISDIWDTRLGPALRRLSEALGIGKGDTDEFLEALGRILGMLLTAGLEGLLGDIALAIDAIALAADLAALMLDGFAEIVDTVAGNVERLANLVEGLKKGFDGLLDIELPDWLTPGSPTPFEIGLRGIADAVIEMPDLQSVFERLGVGGNISNDNRQNVTLYGPTFPSVSSGVDLLASLMKLSG